MSKIEEIKIRIDIHNKNSYSICVEEGKDAWEILRKSLIQDGIYKERRERHEAFVEYPLIKFFIVFFVRPYQKVCSVCREVTKLIKCEINFYLKLPERLKTKGKVFLGRRLSFDNWLKCRHFYYYWKVDLNNYITNKLSFLPNIILRLLNMQIPLRYKKFYNRNYSYKLEDLFLRYENYLKKIKFSIRREIKRYTDKLRDTKKIHINSIPLEDKNKEAREKCRVYREEKSSGI